MFNLKINVATMLHHLIVSTTAATTTYLTQDEIFKILNIITILHGIN